MSLPLCFDILSTIQQDNINSQIAAVRTPEELQSLIDKIYGDIALFQSTIQSELTALAGIEALLTIPLNPGQAVTWVENFITGFLTPYYKNYITLGLQVAQVAANVAAMTALVEEIASTKFPGITITIPSIDPFCSL